MIEGPENQADAGTAGYLDVASAGDSVDAAAEAQGFDGIYNSLLPHSSWHYECSPQQSHESAAGSQRNTAHKRSGLVQQR